MQYYSMENFENENYDKLINIIEKAKKTNKHFLDTKSLIYLGTASYTRIAYKNTPAYRKGFGHNNEKYYNKPDIYTPAIGLQINSIIHQNKLDEGLSEFEKEILKINIIFANDNFFMNCITNNKEDNLISELIEKVENITYNNSDLQKIYRKFEIKNFINSHIKEITETCYRAKSYLPINNETLIHIYNRLLQIKFLRPELYNEYLKKGKKLVK